MDTVTTTITMPCWVRLAVYLVTGLGTPIVMYALAKGWIGELEATLWGAEVAFAMTVAGLNATRPPGVQDLIDE